MERRKVSIGFVVLMIGFMVWGILPAGNSQASPYSKYAGTTLVVNFPSHPYYESAIKLLPEFTKRRASRLMSTKWNICGCGTSSCWR